MRALLTYLLLLALLALVPGFENDPGCITDSECQAHCPPPMDDPDCDGGPQ